MAGPDLKLLVAVVIGQRDPRALVLVVAAPGAEALFQLVGIELVTAADALPQALLGVHLADVGVRRPVGLETAEAILDGTLDRAALSLGHTGDQDLVPGQPERNGAANGRVAGDALDVVDGELLRAHAVTPPE